MKAEDYGGIVDISTAVREYYGLRGSGQADVCVQEWLRKNAFRCVIVLLVDGMGVSVLRKHRYSDGFFLSHMTEETSTVFPPTTTAATTALLTGKYPAETGWLGWNQYFAEKSDQIIMFLNRGQYTGRTYGNYTNEALPVKMIFDELNENGIRAASVWPSWGKENPCGTYAELCGRVEELAKDTELKFIYAYWDGLDTYMHDFGPSDPGTGEMLAEIERLTEKMELPDDCGLLILADHSQIDVTHYDLLGYRPVCHSFVHCPSLEPRACSIWVREGEREDFEKIFREQLGDAFVLMKHDEAVSSGLFGKGTAHPRFEEFIGDYLAVAVKDVQLDYARGNQMKGNHAGGLREEAVIPVILKP